MVCGKGSQAKKVPGLEEALCKLFSIFFFRGGFQGLPPCTKGRRMELTYCYSDASPTTGAKIRQHRLVGTRRDAALEKLIKYWVGMEG